ncbi:MAG: GNAT family N-acetyltransferase [Opitutales bacterium]
MVADAAGSPVYRPVVAQDIPDLFRIRVATWENDRGAEELSALGITPASVRALLGSGDQAGWLAEVADEPVGFALGNRATGELWVVAVLPEHEGRGIGRGLMLRVEAWLLVSGWNRIWLTTYLEDHWRAIGFYRKLGWTFWKQEQGDRFLQKQFTGRRLGRAVAALPATDPVDATYGVTPDAPLGPAWPALPVRFDRVVWYPPAMRSRAMGQILPHIARDTVLIGFSKSGLGALNLALDHPGLFRWVILFDAPLMRPEAPPWDDCHAFYDLAAWAADQPANRLPDLKELTESGTRLLHLSGRGFHDEHVAFQDLLDREGIPATFQPDNAADRAYGRKESEKWAQPRTCISKKCFKPFGQNPIPPIFPILVRSSGSPPFDAHSQKGCADSNVTYA